MLSSLTKSTYEAILKAELRPAMGCTEPIAIAYAASILAELLDGAPNEISAMFSGNIIKNVKSVIVPATGGRHGIEAAIAAGLVSARPDKRLEVLTVLTSADGERIDAVIKECRITVDKLNTGCSFELELYGKRADRTATVKISGAHTNVTEASVDGLDLTENARGNDDTALACYDEANAGNRKLAKKDDENHPNEDESLGDLTAKEEVSEDRDLRADDQKLVGEGIDELAKIGDKIIFSCDLAVKYIGNGGDQEYKRRNDEPPDLDATHKKKREHECGNQEHANK